MAKVTNAFATYSAAANREDLSNIIYNIDPADTPFMSMAGRRNISNRLFDWQTESLPNVDTSNAKEEGFELSRAAATATVRVSNSTQISSRDATVSGSQEQSDAAGKRSEMAHQMALVSKALKRDMESILCQNQARNNGNDSGTARKTRALEHWIQTNKSTAAGYSYTNETTALTDGTTPRAITETMLNDTLEACYTNGAEPTIMLVGPGQKRKVSAFVGRSGSQIPVSKAEVVNTVDLYRSDFGDIKVMPTRWNRNRTALLLDPEYVAVAYFRNFKTVDIATIGDAETKMIVVEYGLEMKNEKAHGKIADLT
jgi:Family of unknown function (DUF5309)